MKQIYEVKLQHNRYQNDQKEYWINATSAERAIRSSRRLAKRDGFANSKVAGVRVVGTLDA